VTSGWQAINATPGAANTTCATNVYAITIGQAACANDIVIAVANAAPFAELYNVISLLCSVPPGGGPLFGLSVGPGSGDPLQQFFLPLGTIPFHVNADFAGAYSLTIPGGALSCPGTPVMLEAVTIQAVGYSVTAVSQTTNCVTVLI
jgi:hypothetical protein